MYKKIISLGLFLLLILKCNAYIEKDIVVGAEKTEEYVPYLLNKNVALVANHASLIHQTHIADSLLALNIRLIKIFSPEHGFRGTADAGEILEDTIDKKTGIPVISLYGKDKKPKKSDLQNIDIIVFDIQDVGVRFYTYFSTMHFVMEACAENNIELLILDRPNPNGFYVDGPVLNMKYKSFVGMHPVPLVHGMTAAEYAQMINEENWLENGKCKLRYVLCENYNHSLLYSLFVNPSPNLRNMNAIYLYPSLGLFEGTVINVGRGTDSPFEVFGHPKLGLSDISYTPKENEGAKNPKYKDKICYGIDLRGYYKNNKPHHSQINLEWLFNAYNNYPDKTKFFNSFFKFLNGNELLEEQIKNNVDIHLIRKGWKKDLKDFLKIRKKYLLYKDFK